MKLDLVSSKLHVIRSQVATAKQYFDGHDMKADEVKDRDCVEKMAFLISVIDTLHAEALNR